MDFRAQLRSATLLQLEVCKVPSHGHHRPGQVFQAFLFTKQLLPSEADLEVDVKTSPSLPCCYQSLLTYVLFRKLYIVYFPRVGLIILTNSLVVIMTPLVKQPFQLLLLELNP